MVDKGIHIEINKGIRMENGIHLRIFLDNLVVITQMAELSKDRRQRQDMRRTRMFHSSYIISKALIGSCTVIVPSRISSGWFHEIDYSIFVFEDFIYSVVDHFQFDAYGNIQKYLEENKYDIVSGEFTRIPTDTKELTPEQRAEVDKILDKQDEDDDVTNVYHNIKEY